MRCQLQPKKTKAVLAVYIVAKDGLPTLKLHNKMKCFSFKSGCVIQVEIGEMRRQL